MPRDVDLRKGFMEQFGYAMSGRPVPKKKPKKKKQVFKEVMGSRSIRMYIAYAAQDKTRVTIRYKKATTGEIKRYDVEPYSYRFRRSKKGRRMKAFYAYDVDEKKIKSFYVANLKGVEPSATRYKPRWSIEIVG